MKEIYMEKEDAVSPVIATILMVAITVVLAATVYILVSHYTTGASTPLAASITEESETSDSVVMSLTYTSPAAMSNPAGLTMKITGTFVATDTYTAAVSNPTGTNPTATVVATATTLTITFSGAAIQSGATITVTDKTAGVTWTGDTVAVTYSGYTGSASTTLP